MKFHSEQFSGHHYFRTFYESLSYCSADKESAVCALLEITSQTLRRYLSGRADPPRAFVALLWHESTHGRATLDEHAHRGMLYQRFLAQGLEAKNAALQVRIDSLNTELFELRSSATRQAPAAINDSFYRAV